MQQYNVTGMSCAACSARVEKAVRQVPGVTDCAVSLLTNSMGVEGSAEARAVIRAVEQAGYGASVKGAKAAASPEEDALTDRQTPALRRRLMASLGFLLVLMYVSMGRHMLGLPLPAFLQEDPLAIGLTQLLLAAAVMVINQSFFRSGFSALWHRAPNMDSLVALGSAASFGWSVYVLYAMSAAALAGEHARLHELSNEFYFESAAMILTLITVGKLLEARSKGKTTDALKSLMRLTPKTAVVLRNGAEQTVPIEQLRRGDVFTVRPGESIPVDGVVLEGVSAVNEAALTGESIPVDKAAGDAVSAATINQSGFLKCEATRVGEDTTLAQIIKMVSDAAATKAPIAKIADKVSGVFVPTVIGIALLAAAIWLLVGESFGYALARGISVLVISCPCALGLATPVAIMVGSGLGAKHGILFKNAASLEQTGRVQIVALDKTGTVTEGMPRVTELLPAEGETAETLLRLAASLEQKSEHPLAGAIVQRAREDGLSLSEVSEFRALPGSGVEAVLDGETLLGGSLKYIQTNAALPAAVTEQAEALSEQGKTPLLFLRGGRFVGIIAAADTVKPDSPQAVRELQRMGVQVVMLTGDNEKTARAIGTQAGVREVVAGVLPDGKEAVIRRLQKQGRVAMVGDGINDAPALTRADVGIAIGAGADVALDAADVVLMHSRLTDVSAAIRLSRATLRNIHQNLFWAFFYNVLGIPLAAGAFIRLFGWSLNPMFGAAAMSLSSFFVVTNALRLNLLKLRDPSSDRPRRDALRSVHPDAEGETLTLRVEGMMCEHCERSVAQALEALEGVSEAHADHRSGLVTLRITQQVGKAALKKAVSDAGYKAKL